MKFDQNKPSCEHFYWDGLAALKEPRLAAIIKAYIAFKANPSITLLGFLFDAVMASNLAPSYLEVVAVHDHGAKKYANKNYLGLKLDRILASMRRHLLALAFGELIDESGFRHSAHLLANILIAAELLNQATPFE